MKTSVQNNKLSLKSAATVNLPHCERTIKQTNLYQVVHAVLWHLQRVSPETTVSTEVANKIIDRLIPEHDNLLVARYQA